jgi:hypothetical protein
MRTSLIVFGVIFLVIGGFLYLMPSQTAQATTTTVGENSSDTRTSYATVSVPLPVTYALLVIGLILAVLGFALPGPRPNGPRVEDSTTHTEEHFTETSDVEHDDGTTKKVAHEKHTRRTHKE